MTMRITAPADKYMPPLLIPALLLMVLLISRFSWRNALRSLPLRFDLSIVFIATNLSFKACVLGGAAGVSVAAAFGAIVDADVAKGLKAIKRHTVNKLIANFFMFRYFFSVSKLALKKKRRNMVTVDC